LSASGSAASGRSGRWRPGNHVSGLILAGEPATGVTAMQDLGPLAARVLLRYAP
jgi:hypothetical protein